MSPNLRGQGRGSRSARKVEKVLLLLSSRKRRWFALHFPHVLLVHSNFTQVLRDFQRLQNLFFNKTELR